MTRNDIKAQFPDATKEQIDALLNINSDDIGRAKGDRSNLETQISQLNQQITALNGQIADKDKSLGELNAQIRNTAAVNANVDALNQQIEQLKRTVADKDATIAATNKQYRIKGKLRGTGAKNVDLVYSLLDTGKITEKDDEVVGLDEQIEALKKSDAYLFDANPSTNQRGGFLGGQDLVNANRTNNDAINNAIRSAFRR